MDFQAWIARLALGADSKDYWRAGAGLTVLVTVATVLLLVIL